MPVAVRELSGAGLVGNPCWSMGQSTIEAGDGGDILCILPLDFGYIVTLLDL